MKLTVEMENFIAATADSMKSHEDWLVLVRFGMSTLLHPVGNQRFLAELLVAEAMRQADRNSAAHHTPADEMWLILSELNLRFYFATPTPSEEAAE